MSGLSGQSQDAWDTGAPTAPAGGGSALDAAALAQLTEAVSRQTLRYADVEGETIAQRQHIARLEEMLHQQVRTFMNVIRSFRLYHLLITTESNERLRSHRCNLSQLEQRVCIKQAEIATLLFTAHTAPSTMFAHAHAYTLTFPDQREAWHV